MHAVPSDLPSRDVVLQWEADRDRLIEDIRAANAKLEALNTKIDAAWVARTPALNDDIMAYILDCFRPPTEFRPISLSGEDEAFDCPTDQFAALSALCRVSKRWLVPCRRLLYQDVWADYFGSEEYTDLLARTFETNPALLLLVKRLFMADSVEAMEKFLGRFTELESVWVEGDTPCLSGLLKLRKLKYIVRCDFDESNLDDAYTSWPALETLIIESDGVNFAPLPPGDTRRFSALRTIGWSSSNVEPTSVPAIAPNTLHTLKLYDVIITDPNLFKRALNEQAGSLRRFEMRECDTTGASPASVAVFLYSATNLQHFRFHDNWFDLDVDTLPLSLRDITIDWPGFPAEASEFIRRRGRGPLQKLDLRGVTSCVQPADVEWGQVKMVAASFGVALSIRTARGLVEMGIESEL